MNGLHEERFGNPKRSRALSITHPINRFRNRGEKRPTVQVAGTAASGHDFVQKFETGNRAPRASVSSIATSTASHNSVEAASVRNGTVAGAPRRWLRVEGATLLVGSLIAYSATHQAWWLVPVTLLVPDLLMVGYLGGTKLGARMYNVAHAAPLPAIVVGLGWWQAKPLVLALGLVWIAHIGMDGVLGYGLKYNDSFQHTHLGWIGRNR